MGNQPVRLGLMPPLSGIVGIYGNEIANAGKVACEEINANGGILGRPLELIIEDDASLPDSAVKAAERLVDQHHCHAIIGNLLSNSRIAVAYQVAEPRKIPYLNFSFYEGSILSRYFFHFAALPNQQIDKMIPYMQQRFGSKVFFAGNNYEWPRGSIYAAKRILHQHGGTVVGEEYCPMGVSPDAIDRLLDNLEQAQPDIFVPYFAGADQVLLLTRFTERGLKKKIPVVMGHYDEMMASQLSAEVRDGFFSSNTYFMSIDSAANQDYLQRLEHLEGIDGIWPEGNGILTNFGEGTYACVHAFAKAAEQAGSLESEALVEALEHIQLSTPQGEIRMHPEHHHAAVNAYLAQCDARGIFHIIEDFGAIEPQLPSRYKHQRLTIKVSLEEEIRLQSRILEQMGEGVLLFDAQDRTVIFANAGAERMYGYQDSDMEGLHLAHISSPFKTDKDNLYTTIVTTMEQKGEWRGEIEYRREDGSTLWCLSNISSFTHPYYGEVWLSVNSDITERKQAEDELENYRKSLESLVEERTQKLQQTQNDLIRSERLATLGQLTATVSHELRNPLGAMRPSLFVIEKINDGSNEKLSQAVTRVNRNIDRCNNIIDELLDYTRISQISSQQVNISEWMDTIINEHQLKQSVETRIHYSLENPQHNIDPERLQRAIINILDNSLHAMQERQRDNSDTYHPCLEVNVHDDADFLFIEIGDNGIGMSSEVKEKLFEPLYSTKGFGVGLGMPTVQQIIKQHNGELSVISEQGVGTTAMISIPNHISKDHTNDQF